MQISRPASVKLDNAVHPGVRVQLLNVGVGKLEMDFVVRPGQRSTHVLNAVSPAWTSALAVAEYVVERIEV